MSVSDNAGWPNIVLIAGELYGLGAPVSIPAPLSAGLGAEGLRARFLQPCPVTQLAGRKWIRASEDAGLRVGFLGDQLVILPDCTLLPP
jgi:hypothetical protein